MSWTVDCGRCHVEMHLECYWGRVATLAEWRACFETRIISRLIPQALRPPCTSEEPVHLCPTCRTIPHRRLLEILLDILLRHRGEAGAITADSLAASIGVREPDNRSLRQAISDLIEDGYCIGSTSVDGRAGYFIVETEEELARVRASLLSRERELSRRREHLDANFERGGPLQPELLGRIS